MFSFNVPLGLQFENIQLEAFFSADISFHMTVSIKISSPRLLGAAQRFPELSVND